MGRKSRTKRERRARRAELERKYRRPSAVKYPVRPRPSAGGTPTERALAALARKTFLSLWSYPNVVRDERRADGAVIGKEIVDLLVVFKDDVVLFSDKDCVFGSSGDLDVDWGRWYRTAIEKSAKQLWGAERHIRDSPDRVFIDRKCDTRLPIRLPGVATMRVHRVVVAHGANSRCREELGGSGSLRIEPAVQGNAHRLRRSEGGKPFCIGYIQKHKPFVHVLDEPSLGLLLGNLDTVSDLVRYLRRREAFICSGRLQVAAGEEALLGRYMTTLNDYGEHDFVRSNAAEKGAGALEERLWYEFLESAEYRRKREADAVSYLWDHIIGQFAKHYMAGTSDHLTEGESAPLDFERVLRFFARESRFRRRLLSQEIVDMQRSTSATLRRMRVIPPTDRGDPYWVLLLFPFADKIRSDLPYERYREGRRMYLHWCLRVVKALDPEAMDVVGFATESGRSELGSEDAAYLDARGWSQAAQEEAIAMQEKLGILVKPNMHMVRAWEYPPAPS